MKKSKITIIAMFCLVGACLIAFIVFFNLGDHFKGIYDEAVKMLAKKSVKNDPELLAYWTNRSNMANGDYTACAVLNYVFSIAAIASLGIGLALADHFKTKEEKAAEDGLEVLVKPGTKKRKAAKPE